MRRFAFALMVLGACSSTPDHPSPDYKDARYAIDTLQNDLYGIFPFSSGVQRFVAENGTAVESGGPARPSDQILFRTTTSVADTLQTCEIEYALIPGSRVPGPPEGRLPGGSLVDGDGSKSWCWSLVRRVRVPRSGEQSPYEQAPKDRVGNVIPDTVLCRNLVGLNFEFSIDGKVFSELEPSPCPSSDPLGDRAGRNDAEGTRVRLMLFRITITMRERKEGPDRILTRLLWLPRE